MVNRRDEFHRDELRERVYGEATSGDGRRSLVGALFAVSLFLLILSLSARQVTEPANATLMLESGIAVLTDIDRLVADEAPLLREQAQQSEAEVFAIPGYPLAIAVDRDELELSDAELIDTVLARSAALVYLEGISAFDTTGEQSLNRLSSEGLLEFAVSRVSQSTHDRASLGAAIFAVSTAGLGILFLITSTGWGRLRGLGFAAAAGALPGLFLFGFFSWVVGQLGGDDVFVADLREITRAGIRVPFRNFGIVFIAGVAMAAAGMALSLAESRLMPAREEPEPEQYGEEPALAPHE